MWYGIDEVPTVPSFGGFEAIFRSKFLTQSYNVASEIYSKKPLKSLEEKSLKIVIY